MTFLSKAILGVRPRTIQMSCGTGDRLALLIDLEMRKIEAVFGFGAALCFPGEQDHTTPRLSFIS